MKGYWKNNVGGWNHKGSKRKKQTHNHFLKDNGLQLLRTYDYNETKVDRKKVYNETVMVHTYYNNKKPIQKTAEVYKIRVFYPNVNSKETRWTKFTEFKTINAYSLKSKFNETWYDNETHKKIMYSLDLNFTQFFRAEIVKIKKINEIEIDWKAKSEKAFTYITKDNTFIYGKPLADWKKNTFYNDGKRRKIGQKIANGSDRMYTRTYIKKGDWDIEIKTHAYSKSISWLVH